MTNELDAEARKLVAIFNEYAPDYAPDLEWFGMTTGGVFGDEQHFVFEATQYIDEEGLDALRVHDREVEYIEAYEFEDEVHIQIQLPVEGCVPGEDDA